MYPLTRQLCPANAPVGTVLFQIQLAMLHRAGFEQVILAVEAPFEISSNPRHFASVLPSKLDVKCETVEEQIGSADILRLWRI